MARVIAEWKSVKPEVRFTRWTVCGYQFRLPTRPKGSRWYCVCECKCGAIRVVDSYSLHAGISRSCGCLQAEIAVNTCLQRSTHGETHTTVFALWSGIKNRCADKTNLNYGGRGIAVFPEWSANFESFRDYVLANGYKPGLQIDRFPNVDGNYEPGNIRLVTCKENNRNRRSNKFLTAFGETKTFVEWSEDERCMVSDDTLLARLTGNRSKTKWAPEAAITTPPLRNGSQRRSGVPIELRGTGNDIKTIYEVRGLTPKEK